jgi:3-dehydroquinate synthase
VQTIPVDIPARALSYPILLGEGVLEDGETLKALAALVARRRCLVISDTRVSSLYGDRVTALLEDAGADRVSLVSFPAGEESKTLATAETLYTAGLEAGLDRRGTIVALGGGVTGDLAGFVAATLYRGIPLVQIPTSLLAMVDSSVGGKVGVDLPQGKNLVGAFYHPRLVIADLVLLRSLPARERRCGLAEVVKYGVIDGLAELPAERMDDIVSHCCRCKAGVVNEDEREQGRREILNYGHTFGHALEVLGGYSMLTHGEAVSIGMGMAADCARALGLLSDDSRERQDRLLRRLGLPVAATGYAFEPEAILEAMQRDKKVRDGRLRLVLPVRMGEVRVESILDQDFLLDVIRDRCG